MVDWHALNKKEVEEVLSTSEEGLSEHDAKSRLIKYGPNELKQISKLNPLANVFGFVPISLLELLMIALASSPIFIIFEFRKFINQRNLLKKEGN